MSTKASSQSWYRPDAGILPRPKGWSGDGWTKGLIYTTDITNFNITLFLLICSLYMIIDRLFPPPHRLRTLRTNYRRGRQTNLTQYWEGVTHCVHNLIWFTFCCFSLAFFFPLFLRGESPMTFCCSLALLWSLLFIYVPFPSCFCNRFWGVSPRGLFVVPFHYYEAFYLFSFSFLF